MADWSLKAHDRAPSIQATLSIGGSPVYLGDAGTSVKFIMAKAQGGSPVVNAAAVIADPVNGVVRYDWAAGDTATPGNYEAEWQVTWADGKEQTFPTLSYLSITILADLDNA